MKRFRGDLVNESHTARTRLRCGRLTLLVAAVGMCGNGCTALMLSHGPGVGAERLAAGKHVAAASEKYERGDLEGALAAAERARRISPKLDSAREIKLQCLNDQGNDAAYLAEIRAAVSSCPDDAHVQARMGQLLAGSGQTSEGIAALRRALAITPRDPQLAQDVASLEMQLGNLPAAIDVLSAAVVANSADAPLQMSLARLHEEQGNWAQASALYAGVLRSNPENVGCRRQYAHTLFQTGNFADAREEYLRCHTADIRALTAADCREYGRACLTTGDLDRAAELFSRLVHEGHDSPELASLRIQCELQRGHHSTAATILRSAQQRWPNDAALAAVQSNLGSVTPAGGLW